MTSSSLVDELDESPDELLARADDAEQAGRLVEAVDLLQRANRLRPDTEVEVRLVGLRDRGFETLTAVSTRTSCRRPTPTSPPGATACPRSRRPS